MRKFLAVVNNEYRKIVLKWTFLIGTLIFPLLAAGFAVIPALIFSIEGEPTRIVVVDSDGAVAERLRARLESADEKASASPDDLSELAREDPIGVGMQKTIRIVEYSSAEKTQETINSDLEERIRDGSIDAYLVVPDELSENPVFRLYSRKSGDFIVNSVLEEALNDAVRSVRLSEANISEDKLREVSRKVSLERNRVDETGESSKDESGFWPGFIIAFLIYLTLAIYGQMILSTVVEEKETRVAEILFSSARPFELMMGKLVGVCLAGLTQLGIWILSAIVLIGIGLAQLSAAGVDLSIPAITPVMVFGFFVYFLLGFFLYASIFALIGSMVTSVQEGGQFAIIPVMAMLGGFYFSFAVIRDPNSSISFWASVLPFTAPMTMPIRMLADQPPFWHVALSILLNAIAIAILIWIAGRIYRVGMLMYGKRASIPELLKWIRQS